VLRTGLALSADLPAGRFDAGPAMSLLGGARIRGLRLGGRSVSLAADGVEVSVEGLPDGVRSGTRPPVGASQSADRT
jgi:hypothetical protein